MLKHENLGQPKDILKSSKYIKEHRFRELCLPLGSSVVCNFSYKGIWPYKHSLRAFDEVSSVLERLSLE